MREAYAPQHATSELKIINMKHLEQPSRDDLWLLPLGGTGEIGMNLNLYGHDGQWLMVDCGISFEDQLDKNGVNQSRVIMPDIEFLKTIKHQIVGIVVTHAHEDHIGALPYLWSQIECPIYASPFTRQVLINKFVRAHCPAPVTTIDPHSTFKLGVFSIAPVAMTHSTPETLGLVISTPAARVFHTADWKIDPDPIIGVPATADLYTNLGELDAVVSDSTNALEPNWAISEATVHEGLLAVIRDAPGRVIVSCFASNIARLQTLGRIAKQTNRYLGLMGYSLDVMHRAAKEAGYLSEDFSVIDCAELGYLPPEEVMVIATGSQGQQGSALHKLALDQQRDLNLSANDQVILSSKTIPGNERSIELLLKHFTKLDVQVWQGETSNLPLHGSGHGGQPELLKLFEWTRPKTLVPVHGEPKHLLASAEIGRQAGIENQLIGANGDRYDLVHASIERGVVKTGRLSVDDQGNLIAVT
ncbi:MAG: ribonuclease J [Dinoroseobacter sp.]